MFVRRKELLQCGNSYSLLVSVCQAWTNVFFAVQPDEEGAEEVERRAFDLCDALGLKGRPMGKGRFHVTLHGIGTYDGVPQDLIARAAEAAKLVEMPPFEVVFDRAMSFRRRSRKRPLVLGGFRSGHELSTPLPQAASRAGRSQRQPAGVAAGVGGKPEKNRTWAWRRFVLYPASDDAV